MSRSEASDDFILIDDEEEEVMGVEELEEPIIDPANAEKSKKKADSGLKSRMKKIRSGISSQIGAVKERLKPRESKEESLEADLQVDAVEEDIPPDISFSMDGLHTFEWPIRGMDCPDCAAKAKRAVNRLPGVQDTFVSATTGTVRLSVDLSSGRTSKISSILNSLGHEPDLKWHQITGVTASGIASKLNISRAEVKRLFLAIPSVLDVRFEDASVSIQIIPNLDTEIISERQKALEKLVGSSFTLKEIEDSHLNSSQWRLVMTIPAIAILVLLLLLPGLNPTIQLVLTLFGIALSGWRMFADAIAGIRNQELGFQLLTSLAVIGALAWQSWVEALLVSILVAISSHMEEAALKKARDSMQGGLDRLPRRARIISTPTEKSISAMTISSIGVVASNIAQSISPKIENKSSHAELKDEMVAIDLVNVGDSVEIRSGEIVPVDGIVTEGIGSLNRAPLTGESIPVRVEEGDDIHAGLVLDRGPIIVKATAIGDDTRLSGLIDEVRTFRETPPRVQSTVENFSRIWVPTVLVGAVLAGLIMDDLRIMLLLWVVACPCALLLAAPIPHAAALSTASRIGVVARGGHALEAASRIDLALLDKTGTLTSGHPRLDQVLLGDGIERKYALRLAAGLEKRSNHPYAEAVLKVADKESAFPLQVTKIKDGRAGVQGFLKGTPAMFGRIDWLESEGISIPLEFSSNVPQGQGVSVLVKDGVAIAAFTFIHDDLRDGAAEMIHDLRALGVSVELLSGDSQSAVEALGRDVGVVAEHCRGEIDPKGKAIWVERRSQGRHTLMAGDGFNDAAALAAADVGIAVGSGEQVNLDAADVLIPGEDPRVISNFVRLSRRTRGIVQANIFISVAVTVLLVVAVLLGVQTHLAVGVAIHEASAFLVIVNGAFVASSGNRFALIGEVFKDLFRDYGKALKMLFSRQVATSV